MSAKKVHKVDKRVGNTRIALRNIMAATDFSAHSVSVLTHGAAIARRYRSKFYVAHVIPTDVYKSVPTEVMDEALKQTRAPTRGSPEQPEYNGGTCGRSDLPTSALQTNQSRFRERPESAKLEHDSDQIHQLLLNLLLNAVQAIDGAGAIRVEVLSLKGDAAIAVIDTGRGIAPEHLPNIFRPFYTTKGNGTGLGLSLSRRIAEEHHGRIEVTSEVGKGTKLLVVLPLQQADAQAGAS